MHAVVRTDKMYGTRNPTGLVSARYAPDGVVCDIDNGHLIKLGFLEPDDTREVYVGEVPSSVDSIGDVVLVATPEVMYDKRAREFGDFYNKAGALVRGYYLHNNDVFSVTADCLTGDIPKVGSLIELTDGTQMGVAAVPTGATVIGKIININRVNKYTFYVIKISDKIVSSSGSGSGVDVARIPETVIDNLF